VNCGGRFDDDAAIARQIQRLTPHGWRSGHPQGGHRRLWVVGWLTGMPIVPVQTESKESSKNDKFEVKALCA
jgi:hypothetical protein